MKLFLQTASLAALVIFTAACSSATAPVPTAPAPTPTPAPATPEPAPALPPTAPPAAVAPATARYRVTFDSTWTAATHPVDFPSTAHFSPLVGGTHNASARFWGEGLPASLGIRDMAERGLTVRLDQEVGAAIAAGTAERVLLGGAIGTTPGSTSFDFEISQTHPLVTLVTMVAPSPDWFVGVAGLPLFESGRWTEQRRVELVPWDAGTDNGATFTSPDAPATPTQGVARIVTSPLSPNGRVTPLGTFTFTQLQP